MKNISISIFITFSLFCLAPYAQSAGNLGPKADAAKEVKIQQPSSPTAPDFTLKDLSGKTLSLKDYRGKVVLLDFTTTWCPYCRYDIPKLKKLYEANKGKDFELLAIYINESPKKVSSFASQYTLTYPVLLDTDASVARDYGIKGVPTKVVVRKDGTISCLQCTDAEGKINEILKEK
jgi:peroxiredoxin